MIQINVDFYFSKQCLKYLDDRFRGVFRVCFFLKEWVYIRLFDLDLSGAILGREGVESGEGR